MWAGLEPRHDVAENAGQLNCHSYGACSRSSWRAFVAIGNAVANCGNSGVGGPTRRKWPRSIDSHTCRLLRTSENNENRPLQTCDLSNFQLSNSQASADVPTSRLAVRNDVSCRNARDLRVVGTPEPLQYVCAHQITLAERADDCQEYHDL